MPIDSKQNKNSKTPKELIGQSWKHLKASSIHFWKFLWNAIAWTHKAVDALDKTIGKIWKPSKNKIANFTRNNLIKILVPLTILTYGGVKTVSTNKDVILDQQEAEIVPQGNSKDTMCVVTSKYPIFHDKKITKSAPLTKHYLWLDVSNKNDIIIWDTLIMNPANSLRDLWKIKISKYGSKTIEELDKMNASKMSATDKENFRINHPIDATYLFVVRPYIDGHITKTQVSLDQFIALSEYVVRKTEKDISHYNGGLNAEQQKIFNILKKDISWKSLVAYAMTELCENKESWETNKQLFDLVLQNAWIEFLALVPAEYDPKTSYGLYQFTEYALYDAPDGKRWASIVNKQIADKENKLPGSVIDLHAREDQTKAAYLFGLHNFIFALKNLNDQQVKKLLEHHDTDPDAFMNNMTQLMAMCHHRPADNVALKARILEDFKCDMYRYGKAQTYGKASKVNYEALTK